MTNSLPRYSGAALLRIIAGALMVIVLYAFDVGPVSAETKIHVGDKVRITVFNHPDLSAEVSVSSDGAVMAPLAGPVLVAGLSESAASKKIVMALRPYLRFPSVMLMDLDQAQSIFFSGESRLVLPYAPGETLEAAIGGYEDHLRTEQADMAAAIVHNLDLRRVRVQRDGVTLGPFNIEEIARHGEAGPTLEPADVIILAPRPIKVTIRGNLKSPMTVYQYPEDSLGQAVAVAGGLSATTSLSNITLERDGFKRVVSAAGEDFLEPAHDGDIVTLAPAPHVTVLGTVEKPGDVVLQEQPTLLNAIYMAGGPSKFASLGKVRLVHEGKVRVINVAGLSHGDLSGNVAVSDGDSIFVPHGIQLDPTQFASIISGLATFAIAVQR